MAIDLTQRTGKKRNALPDPNDSRRKHPFHLLKPGDWFEFPAANLPTIRSCAHAFRQRQDGVAFSIGKDPNNASNAICVRLT